LANPGFSPAPISGGGPAHKGDYAQAQWVRKIVDVVNLHQQGKLNVTLTATLQSGSTATIIRDARISAFSGLLFTPLTANAAALADSIYVTTQGDGEVILAHSLVGSGDCTFTVCIIG
jgi:hypothetical protein